MCSLLKGCVFSGAEDSEYDPRGQRPRSVIRDYWENVTTHDCKSRRRRLRRGVAIVEGFRVVVEFEKLSRSILLGSGRK